MRDEEHIAISVWNPMQSGDAKSPTIIRGTRYWRDYDSVMPFPGEDGTNEEAALVNARGYSLVLVDSRGSGASFGSRQGPWKDAEQQDYAEIVDWIQEQPWSDGNVMSYGISYDGNVADYIGHLDNDGITAVAPQFSDVDPYLDLAAPGGVRNDVFVAGWSALNDALDRNDVCALSTEDCDIVKMYIRGVRPVDADPERILLDNAVLRHVDNANVAEAFSLVNFRDDPLAGSAAANPSDEFARLDAASIPRIVLASWMDAGTAAGALKRFANTSTAQTIYIGPWTHGGYLSADPFLGENSTPERDQEVQFDLILDYFDQSMSASPPTERTIHYYTLGEQVWRTSSTWPPQGVVDQTLFLSEGGALTSERPKAEASDSYPVDFAHSTGSENRWMQGDEVQYSETDSGSLLTYTGSPLADPQRITGTVSLDLSLDSSRTDGTLLVYLHSVAPDGTSTYITEGILRLANRNIEGGLRTYARADAQDMVPGQRETIRLDLQPTSALLPAGHRIRISIAGHDVAVFQRIPAKGPATMTIHRGGVEASTVHLPIVQ